MMVTLNIQHLRKGLDWHLQCVTQLINFGIIPFIAYILGRLFFPDQPFMALGLLLASLLPTSGMTISWTGFAKGNMGATINMTVIGLILGSLATPFYVNWLLGAQVEVSSLGVSRQIGIILFLPMLAGYLTRVVLLRKFGNQEEDRKIHKTKENWTCLRKMSVVLAPQAGLLERKMRIRIFNLLHQQRRHQC